MLCMSPISGGSPRVSPSGNHEAGFCSDEFSGLGTFDGVSGDES